MMQPQNIIIKQPLVDLTLLDITDEENTVFESETFLPRILVKYGLFKSTSQIKKNRPDLWRDLTEPEFTELKIGHRRVWLVVGK